MTKVREAISKNIRKYRELAKISQKELAEQLKVSQQTVSDWEKGVNSIDDATLISLCKILDIKIEQIVTTEDPNNSDNNSDLESIIRKIECDVKALERCTMLTTSYFKDLGEHISILGDFLKAQKKENESHKTQKDIG